MRRVLRLTILLTILAIGVIALCNSSFWVSPQTTRTLLAHRGLAQTYPATGLTATTCTAARIYPPEHAFIENTLPSMRAAFAAGADIVELDVHPTTDGQIAVFHDWTLDCRTDGHGVTRDHSLADLKKLDVGYGYTADGAKTFPLRGIKDSPPYLHDNRLMTLEDTVEFFNLVLGTGLTTEEKADLTAFLRVL